MKLGEKLKVTLVASCFVLCYYGATLGIGYSVTSGNLSSYEKKTDIENTLKMAEDWMKEYDQQQWYSKPIYLGKKWAVESYIKDHQKK